MRSVSGMFFEFLWFDLSPMQTGFDAVRVALLRSTRVLFATIQQAFRDVVLLHAEDMPHPPEIGLDEDGFNAGGFSTVRYFKVADMVLPSYS